VFDVDPAGVSVAAGHVRVEPAAGAPVDLLAGADWSADVARGPTVSATQSLADARHALARGQVARARELATSAKARATSSTERAEADTLLAECDRAQGDSAAATDKYEAAAKQYEGSAAGETALFAAGKSADESGNRARARSLFQAYLSKYPSGRYAAEATRRMNQGDN
jgi:TolA-binding protein